MRTWCVPGFMVVAVEIAPGFVLLILMGTLCSRVQILNLALQRSIRDQGGPGTAALLEEQAAQFRVSPQVSFYFTHSWYIQIILNFDFIHLLCNPCHRRD